MAERVVGAFHLHALGRFAGLLELAFERGEEALLGAGEQHAVLRALRAGERGQHGGDVELEHVGEDGIGGARLAPHALRLRIGLDEGDALVGAAGLVEIGDGLAVDGEEAAGGAVFRGHVADGGAVGEREMVEAGAEELDELADHALLAQHLGDGEHEVGGGDALVELAGQLEADHLGDEHGDRLAEHGRLGLDAAHAPAEHAEAVHHGGVAVGADAGVGIGDGRPVLVLGPHGLRQIFEVHLVADAGAGRHDAEIVEGRLAPFQEAVALLVLLVLLLDVLAEGGVVAEEVDDHRVVDDEVDRHQRVDALGVAAEIDHGVAHGGEVDHGGNAGEVLHQHARGAVGDLALGLAAVEEPVLDGDDVVLGDGAAVLEAEQILQQHLHGEGQGRDAFEAVLFGLRQAVIDVGLGPDGESFPAFEAVERRHG